MLLKAQLKNPDCPFFFNSGKSIIFFHATTIYSVANKFLFHDKQSMKLADRVYQLK